MIPVIIGAGILGVGLVTWLLSDDSPEAILEKNFLSLGHIINGSLSNKIIEKLFPNSTTLMKNYEKYKQIDDSIKGKKILILGQPGAGKSSLLWNITDKKCSPKPSIGQQTDATHWHDKEMTYEFFTYHKDIVYVDIPGYGTTTHPCESYTKFFPFKLFDLTIFMINGKIKKSDEEIMKHLREVNKKDLSKNLLLVNSFCDTKSPDEREDIKQDLDQHFNSKEEGLDIIFTDNRTNEGIDRIKHFIDK